MPLDRRLRLAGLLFAAFAALTLAVVLGSPVDSLDGWARSLFIHHHPGPRAGFVFYLVEFGQRGPTTKAAFVLYVVVCLRRRSLDPMLLFWSAVLMNNLLVGFAKVGIGRWGPRVTADPVSVFAGGDIFPSGHVTNAVVLFGALALTTTHFRKPLAVAAVAISLVVGFGTVWLDTHWLSDVIGGWIAGSIVLLLVPRWDGFTDRALTWARQRFGPRPPVVAPEGAVTDEHAHAA